MLSQDYCVCLILKVLDQCSLTEQNKFHLAGPSSLQLCFKKQKTTSQGNRGHEVTPGLEEYASHALNSNNNRKDKYSVLCAHCVPCITHGISKLPCEMGILFIPILQMS